METRPDAQRSHHRPQKIKPNDRNSVNEPKKTSLKQQSDDRQEGSRKEKSNKKYGRKEKKNQGSCEEIEQSNNLIKRK